MQYRISHDPQNKHKVCVFEVYVSAFQYVVHAFKLNILLLDEYQENQAAPDLHIESEVSKNNVAFYAAGGLAKPLEEMDIRMHTEYR